MGLPEITFRPLDTTERNRLLDALRGNAADGAALLTDRRDTSFAGTADEVTDSEVITAIRSVPCHYSDDHLYHAAEEHTVPRTGQAPLTFRGECLASADGEVQGGKDRNRWHEISVYRTPKGAYVVRVAYKTRWQGELDHDFAETTTDASAVATILRGYDPTEFVQGFPEGAAYESKQARMLADLRLRYESLVSEALASDEAFAERVE